MTWSFLYGLQAVAAQYAKGPRRSDVRLGPHPVYHFGEIIVAKKPAPAVRATFDGFERAIVARGRGLHAHHTASQGNQRHANCGLTNRRASRAPSSPASPSPACCSRTRSRSAWMATASDRDHCHASPRKRRDPPRTAARRSSGGIRDRATGGRDRAPARPRVFDAARTTSDQDGRGHPHCRRLGVDTVGKSRLPS
jgi:hypothetical protein